MTDKPDLDTDLRNEVLKYLSKNMEEPRPRFPTEYSALMYVALGTLRLLHEATTNYNMHRIKHDKEPVHLHYTSALQEIVQLLEALAPQMQEPEDVAAGIITGKFNLS